MKHIVISRQVSIPIHEIKMQAIRAQGAGGQHVNKVSSAIHLRFDIKASSLPAYYKEKLLQLCDHRITQDGLIIIKSQEHRSQDLNRQAAQERLLTLIRQATSASKTRRATRPRRAAKQKRMDKKTQRGQLKTSRCKVDY